MFKRNILDGLLLWERFNGSLLAGPITAWARQKYDGSPLIKVKLHDTPSLGTDINRLELMKVLSDRLVSSAYSIELQLK